MRKPRLNLQTIEQLINYFIAGSSARTAAALCGVSPIPQSPGTIDFGQLLQNISNALFLYSAEK